MPFDIVELINLLTVKASIGPPQWAVIGASILVVKYLKAHPDIPTPKKVRPLLYFGAALVCNVVLELILDTLSLKTLLAEQVMVWVAVLGLRHLIDAPKAVDPHENADPRDGRMGDPRRP